MRIQHQILGNLNENKEDWYYLCNDAEQALFKVKNECKDERAIKTIERMILELNSIRMEQYNALKEYDFVFEEDNNKDILKSIIKAIEDNYVKEEKEYYKKYGMDENKAHPPYWTIEPNGENGIIVDIPWGDWKHDHGYCSSLVERTANELGYDCVEDESEVYEEDGSDTYSAKHYFYFDINLNESTEEIYSNLDNMVDALRTNFKGITNQDYIKKSLRFHYDNDFISEDEYKELYNEFIASKNSVVKNYEDLPFEDFRARNTIGTLKDGKNFVIFDDNDVYIIKGSIEELKKIMYSDDEGEDKFNEFMDKNSKRADDKLETQILVDTKRLSPEVLDESTDSSNMVTVSIYQIKDTSNCDYAFRDYEESADKINLADYDMVATIDLPDSDSILDIVFMYGNTDKSKFNMIKPMRSISVSDIIEYNGTKYYVDDTGFKEL